MQTRTRLEDLAGLGVPLHLALGVFDGVHIGHQEVISRAVHAAKFEGGLAGIVTFEPHPIRIIAPAKAPAALLETLEHKSQAVGALGAELFVPLPFDLNFAKVEAIEFLENLTAGGAVKTIAVGEDWRFGHLRGGDVTLLEGEAARLGYRLEAVPPVMQEGERISSTRIRQAIRDGNIATAEKMLGRPYTVSGTIIRGRQLGRTLGFPTANVITGSLQLPPDGVWAVIASTSDHPSRIGVANLGLRPTVDGDTRVLEVHLFDFTGDLYGKSLEIRFQKHLREEIRFPSIEALRTQIQHDAQLAREFFILNGQF